MILDSIQRDLTGREVSTQEGSFSDYYNLGSGIGVKVIYNSNLDYACKRAFKTEKALKKSTLWRAARKELSILKHVAASGITPEPFDVLPVFANVMCHGKGWYPGIYMQHINGKTLAYNNFDIDKRWRVQLYIASKIKKYIRTTDIHSGNIMVEFWKTGRVRKYWLIDMSPQFNHIKK